MKDERNVRRRRAAGFRWQPVAILLAAVLMVLSVPVGLKSAHAVDLDQNCSLTVNYSTSDITLLEDIETANVVVDLYRIADATAVQGYDTYDWTMNEPFSSITIDKEIDSDGWKTVAKDAADIVLGTAPEGKTEWDPSESVAAIDSALVSKGNATGTQITDLKAGLYLIIAHGSDIDEYAASVTDETEGTTSTVTIANSKGYAYKFSPELISLPTKDADENEIINTANTGDWIYDATANLKPSQEVRIGRLKITKNLLDYAQRQKTSDGETRLIKDAATFIFEVTVYEDDTKQEVAYHDYVSIVFDAYGSRSVIIENLPVGGYAEVKEEYSGRVYTTDTDKNTTILADTDENAPAEVQFTNTYTDKESGGGSVTNNFSYSENDGWTLKQVTDNTEESVANPTNTYESK